MDPSDKGGLEMLVATAKRFQSGIWRADDDTQDRIDSLIPAVEAHVSALDEGGSWGNLVRRNPSGARAVADAITELDYLTELGQDHFGNYGEGDPGLPDGYVQGPYVRPKHIPVSRAKQRELVRKKQIHEALQRADTLAIEGDKAGARRIREQIGLEQPEPVDDAADAVLIAINAGKSDLETAEAFASLNDEQQISVRRRLTPQGLQAWEGLLSIERDEGEARAEMARSGGSPHGEIVG